MFSDTIHSAEFARRAYGRIGAVEGSKEVTAKLVALVDFVVEPKGNAGSCTHVGDILKRVGSGPWSCRQRKKQVLQIYIYRVQAG